MEIIYTSAKRIARLIREKKVSSLDVVKAHLVRIEEVNSRINAVVQICGDRAIEEARSADIALSKGRIHGVLHGVPFTLKDSHETAGVVSTGSTRAREHHIPENDSTVAARLRNAGAILIGKTNTPELTISAQTDSPLYGRTNNPYDITRTPGGSSGGAAANVASGGAPFDVGSDYGGSIRYPAHFCGVAGIMPTSGRVPRTGHIVPYGIGAVDSFHSLGPIARFVEDLVLVLSVISGMDWHDPYIVPVPLGNPGDVCISRLRVAFYTDDGKTKALKEVVSAVEGAARSLSDAGARVEEKVPPALHEIQRAAGKVKNAVGIGWLNRLLDGYGATKENSPLRVRMKDGLGISSKRLALRMEALDKARSNMLQFMESFDLILSPVAGFPAIPHEAMDDLPSQYAGGLSFAKAYNFTGWPCTVVRCGSSPEGLPVGIQIVARPWREDVSLAAAQHLENALGGWKVPSL